MTRVLTFFDTVGRVMRAILGVPDYEKYVAHCHECHPGIRPLTLEQFSAERLEKRYGQPGSRCC
jgi:uncharacterized short protein YbdD (DUF466 family)